MEQCNNEFEPQDQQSKVSSAMVERPPSSGSEVPCLKIVYVFAGHRRRADVREHLENLALSSGFTLDMHEFDLMRDTQIMMSCRMRCGQISKPLSEGCSPFVSLQHRLVQRTSTRCRRDLGLYGADSILLAFHGCLNLTDRRLRTPWRISRRSGRH